jgi:GNAT superfamily N-acetyltransferase
VATDVITFYLEMLRPEDFRAGWSARPGLAFTQVAHPCPDLNRFFYTTVGAEYYWIDRLGWKHADWMRYLDRPTQETWVLSEHGAPAGYCELDAQDAGSVEIASFGLLPQWVGKGIGAHLLSAAIDRAWRFPARRVWVHTCTLDHPRALQNYLDRGFRLFREERTLKTLPPKPGAPSAAGQ